VSSAGHGLRVREYEPQLAQRWDEFVRASKNATFLLERGYMDYHADRFIDCSLILEDADGRWLAVLPANRKDDIVGTHDGLTYGGFVVSSAMTTPLAVEVFEATRRYLVERGVRSVIYKTIPYIYHRVPAEEDRYALFLHDAQLIRRDVLAVLDPSRAPRAQERRRRAAKKARAAGVVVKRSERWADYWGVLQDTLWSRHRTTPVHSLEEIQALAASFPENITLWVAELDGQVTAGVVIYDSPQVAHVQYIASSDVGRNIGSLDLLFEHLILDGYRQRPYFDFGISNEQDGRVLNLGLIEQKEGFGARAVTHDFYEWRLDRR
jgi:hypothetical protein